MKNCSISLTSSYLLFSTLCNASTFITSTTLMMKMPHYYNRNDYDAHHSIRECDGFRKNSFSDKPLWRYKHEIMKNVDETDK